MSEIAVRQDYAPVSYIPDAAAGLVQWAESATAAYELARRLVTTGFAPVQYRGKPDEAAAAMLAGAEVGLSPMASLRAFDYIQGQAAPRAITLRAILQSMGHKLDYTVMTPSRVVVRGLRRGDTDWQTVEWTIKRAQDLGLTGKDQWKKQPQTMLVARATSEVARLIASDAILGIPYSAEELVDSEPEPTTTVTRATTKVTRRKAEPAQEPPEPSFDNGPEPDAEPEPASETGLMITDKQLKMLHALFGQKGFHDREDRLDYTRSILGGTPVESSRDLTRVEASSVIDALNDLSDGQVEG